MPQYLTYILHITSQRVQQCVWDTCCLRSAWSHIMTSMTVLLLPVPSSPSTRYSAVLCCCRRAPPRTAAVVSISPPVALHQAPRSPKRLSGHWLLDMDSGLMNSLKDESAEDSGSWHRVSKVYGCNNCQFGNHS